MDNIAFSCFFEMSRFEQLCTHHIQYSRFTNLHHRMTPWVIHTTLYTTYMSTQMEVKSVSNNCIRESRLYWILKLPLPVYQSLLNQFRLCETLSQNHHWQDGSMERLHHPYNWQSQWEHCISQEYWIKTILLFKQQCHEDDGMSPQLEMELCDWLVEYAP